VDSSNDDRRFRSCCSISKKKSHKSCETDVSFWCPRPGSNRHGRHRPTDFKSVASAYSATRAHLNLDIKMEGGTGFEPVNGGFADRSVSTSPSALVSATLIISQVIRLVKNC
jgi:hypothetical protein